MRAPDWPEWRHCPAGGASPASPTGASPPRPPLARSGGPALPPASPPPGPPPRPSSCPDSTTMGRKATPWRWHASPAPLCPLILLNIFHPHILSFPNSYS